MISLSFSFWFLFLFFFLFMHTINKIDKSNLRYVKVELLDPPVYRPVSLFVRPSVPSSLRLSARPFFSPSVLRPAFAFVRLLVIMTVTLQRNEDGHRSGDNSLGSGSG